LKEREMGIICEMIDAVLKRPGDTSFMDSTRAGVREMCKRFPFYSRIYDI
jgi:glycine/serine hydroxymethyltransferase